MATGTFQLDGTHFPKDPLRKNWVRPPVGVGGKRKTLFADKWVLQLNFPRLQTQTEHNFFWQKFMAGGLYNAVLPHPSNGKLFSASGVSIDEYDFTFDERDNNSFAVNPRMTLSGPNALAYSVPDWFDTNYKWRQNFAHGTVAPSGTYAVGDTLRIYASGSTAQNLWAKSQVSGGKDIRVVWAQDQKELARDIRIWSQNVVEILFRAQDSQSGSEEVNNKYYLYYGNPQANDPPQRHGDVYGWYSGIEGGQGLSEFNRGAAIIEDAHAQNQTRVYAGSYSLRSAWGAGWPVPYGGIRPTAQMNYDRAEVTFYLNVDELNMTSQTVRIGIHSGGTFRVGIELDENLDIYYYGNGSGSVDTTANLTADTWTKFEIQVVPGVTGTAEIRMNDILIYSGGAFAPFTDCDGFILTYGVSLNPAGGPFVGYVDEIKFRQIARVEPYHQFDTEESSPA